MTDETIGIIASNLTVAYVTRYTVTDYNALPVNASKPQTLGEIQHFREQQQVQILDAYEFFKTFLSGDAGT